MTIFESSSFWVIAFLIGWTALGFLIGPMIGRRLKKARQSQLVAMHPLPSGSLHRSTNGTT
jgi:hypothetical protein